MHTRQASMKNEYGEFKDLKLAHNAAVQLLDNIVIYVLTNKYIEVSLLMIRNWEFRLKHENSVQACIRRPPWIK